MGINWSPLSHLRIRFPESFRNYTPDYWFKMPISAHFFDRLMKSKTTITLSAMAIAAFVLLLASGPLVSDHQALAYRHYGDGASRTLRTLRPLQRTSRRLRTLSWTLWRLRTLSWTLPPLITQTNN